MVRLHESLLPNSGDLTVYVKVHPSFNGRVIPLDPACAVAGCAIALSDSLENRVPAVWAAFPIMALLVDKDRHAINISHLEEMLFNDIERDQVRRRLRGAPTHGCKGLSLLTHRIKLYCTNSIVIGLLHVIELSGIINEFIESVGLDSSRELSPLIARLRAVYVELEVVQALRGRL